MSFDTLKKRGLWNAVALSISAPASTAVKTAGSRTRPCRLLSVDRRLTTMIATAAARRTRLPDTTQTTTTRVFTFPADDASPTAEDRVVCSPVSVVVTEDDETRWLVVEVGETYRRRRHQ
jgi:hypothetical protein